MFGRKKKPDYAVNDLTVYSEHVYKARAKNYHPNYVYLSTHHKREDTECVARLKGSNGRQVSYPIRFDDAIDKKHFILPTQLQHILGLKTGSKLTVDVHPVSVDEKDHANGVNLILSRIDNQPATEQVDQAKLEGAARKSLEGYLLQPGQHLTFALDRHKIEVEVQSVLLTDGFTDDSRAAKFGLLSKQAFLTARAAESDSIDHIMAELQEIIPDALEIPLDFAELGVGGHKQIIQSLIRRVFYTRVMSESCLQAYGVEKHARGVLLYGPPGTGKTLIAKTIAELLPQSQYVEINGPEVMSSYVGASQGNIGAIFDKAKQNPNKLFIFFFDEIEAISRTRQEQGGTSAQVGNEMVSRLLAELDGAKSADNVVFIAATNRKELIDPAILRSGRLDAQFYVGLPDLAGRLEILQIHTRNMTTLASDVNLHVIAEKTKNYSGAELANLVKVARSYAMSANLDDNLLVLKMKEVRSDAELAKVTQMHFLRALNEVRPDFGSDHALENGHHPFTCYSNHLKMIIDDFNLTIKKFLQRPGGGHLNYLLAGDTGTGKTTLAEHLTLQTGLQHVQVVRAVELLLMNESEQRLHLQTVFAKTRESREDSVILLDGLEELIQADAERKEYNNKLALIINALLKDNGPRENKLVVIATCESSEFLSQIRLGAQFYATANLPYVTLNSRTIYECDKVLTAIGSALGLTVKNDLDDMDTLHIKIPVAKLIDELHQFSTAADPKGTISLRAFLKRTPDKYHVHQPDAAPTELSANSYRPMTNLFGRQ